MTIYAPGTTGNAFPTATLAGSSTLLSYPSGIDVDSAGRVYVANQYDNDIHVYAPGATGNSAPVATLGGGASGIAGPGALAVTPPLAILTTHLPEARVGRYYRVHLLAGDGRPPYRWQIVRGTLPGRLRLRRDASSRAGPATRGHTRYGSAFATPSARAPRR